MKMTEDQIDEEVGFIERHQAWPNWPVLPVKNIHRGEKGHPEDEHCGILMATLDGMVPEVILMNMWALQGEDRVAKFEAARRIRFDSIEGMVHSGWVAD